MSPKDLEVLYGLLLKKDYHNLFHAFIVVILGQGTHKRFNTEGEDKLAVEAFTKVSHMYNEQELEDLKRQ